MSGGSNNSVQEVLAWYVAAGADEAIGETPRNRLSPAAVATRPAATATAEVHTPAQTPRPAQQSTAAEVRAETVQAPPPALQSAGDAARDARAIAAGCADLDALRAAMGAFEGCALKRTATNLVFADGNPKARVMFVGEAPGADEDRDGVPFVGAAGKLLDRMLAAVGLDRTSVYITNILPWRPPGNRNPTPGEIAVCLPFVRRHIELVAPQVLVLVGKISAGTLLDTAEGITRIRGRWRVYRDEDAAGGTLEIPALPVFHTAYLLRSPSKKKEAWRDMLAIKKRLLGNDAVPSDR